MQIITIFEIIAWFEDRKSYVRFEKLKKEWSILKDLFLKSSFVRDSVFFFFFGNSAYGLFLTPWNIKLVIFFLFCHLFSL